MQTNLTHTINIWLGELEHYSFEKLLTKPSTGSWSLGQLYVHLMEETKFYLEQAGKCTTTNDNENAEATATGKQWLHNNEFPDERLLTPFGSSNMQQPASKEQLINDLKLLSEEINTTEQLVAGSHTKGKIKHAGFGYFTAGEWLQYAGMHARHHFRQKRRIDNFLKTKLPDNNLFKITVFRFIVLLLLSATAGAQPAPDSLFKTLVAAEQQLADAIAPGNKILWEHKLHDSCIIVVEDGSRITKQKFLESLQPLPPAYNGMIKVIEPKAQLHNNTVILSFIDDEYLELYGQKIHTRYRQTDTWIKTNREWKIIAMQVFEIPANPVPVHLPETVLQQYAGVYELSPGRKCLITIDKDRLYAQKNNKEPTELLAETENVFFRKNDGRVRVLFFRDDITGKFKMIERRAGQDVVWYMTTTN